MGGIESSPEVVPKHAGLAEPAEVEMEVANLVMGQVNSTPTASKVWFVNP